MEIIRFDDEVSIPIAAHGSRFRASPLVGDDSHVGVALFRMAAGDIVGRHPATIPQLFAVVTGSVEVHGGDGAGRTLDAGYGALWAAGEEHDARSPGGATVVCIEGRFDVWALGVSADIVVEDYDPRWPAWFADVVERVWPAVVDIAVRIDHVGSTSVPGLAAKPIIDMDIVVATPEDVEAVRPRLQGLGYRWRGDLGVIGRESFQAPGSSGLPRHHLYVVVEDNRAHLDHWLLRDLLRTDEAARQRYGELKRRNVELAAGDMDVYVAAKAALVAELLTRARADGGWPAVEYWQPEVPAPADR